MDVEALKLERGGIYAIELDYVLPSGQRREIVRSISEHGERLGVTFIVLEKGMKLSRASNG